MKLWLKGAKQIVQVVSNGQLCLTKEDMKSLAIMEANDEGLSIIIDELGKIVDLGPDSKMATKYSNSKFESIIDVTGKSIIPGIYKASSRMTILDKSKILDFCFVNRYQCAVF